MRAEIHTFATDVLPQKAVNLSTNSRHEIGQIQTVPGINRKIKAWGDKNDLPRFRDKVLMDNNIVGELLDTKRNILLGHGLQPYKEVYENGQKRRELVAIPADIRKWLKESNFYEMYLDMGGIQLYKHANVPAEFILDNEGKVYSVKAHDCRYVRAIEKEKSPTGEWIIPGFVYSTVWTKKSDTKDIDDLSRQWPIEIKNYDWHKRDKKLPRKFILWIKDNVFDDGYYAHPQYWGGYEWIKTSNAIPVFHEANIENGYGLRFLIKYPEGYFLDKVEYDNANTKGDETKVRECLDKERSAKQEFINKINDLLKGASNSGKTVFTEMLYDYVKKEYVGITIEPINYDMKDEALIKLFEKSNQANISAQGIHPTLANVESQGKLSSGSEMRNAFLFYVVVKTPRPRRLLLKAFDLVCKINGWDEKYPDLHWTFEDFMITKLDEDKSGVRSVNEANTGDNE